MILRAVIRSPVILEGSNDDSPTWTSGNWTLIYANTNITAWTTLWPADASGADTSRFHTQTFYFDNVTPYKSYRWTVVRTQGNTDGSVDTCCMQIGEVQMLGTSGPKNVVQPGDPIVASSSNSPGSEGVANAIDGTTAKYLNRDLANDATPAGFVVTPSVGATVITGLAMESANDSPSRDPKAVIVEGSNDDSPTWTTGNWTVIYANTNITAWTTLWPADASGADTSRFHTQTFYFDNVVSYTHYRWTVTRTQGNTDGSVDTCCMQIGEVQFLAVTSSTDCSKTAFTLQPSDAPALPGTPATFYAGVNGPWPVQWSVNGTPIPGATALSYSTPPVTAAITTNVYTVAIVGCQESDPVHAKIFTPSAPTSIGIQFWGSGANGAGPQGNVDPNRPNHLEPTDIVGVQPQAYWNVATNASGMTGDQANLPDVLTDSSGNSSTVTFEFNTGGSWGAGTGVSTPNQIMLNGNVGTTTAATDQTMIFHNVPAGKHSVLVYCVSSPLQFTTTSYKIGSQTYYIRIMNSDEWKPAPGFYRGTSTDPKNPSVADFIRFDNVSPDANGDVTLTYDALSNTGQGNATGVNAIQLVLNAPAVGAPPTITQNPSPVVGPTNGVVNLTVQATGDNLTYQWRKGGKNLPNGGHVSGATTSTLTISSLSSDDAAVYSVAVFNAAGSVVSENATVNVSAYNINDALVGYWKLDETSGTTAANAVAGGQAGTVNGTAAWSAGQVGNSLNFDGITTYVVVPNYPKATKSLSVSGWVKVPQAPGASVALVRNAEGNLGVSVAQDGAPASQFELMLNADASGVLFTHVGITAGPNHSTVDAPSAFSYGSWQHLAFTADGAQLTLYVNGVAVASTAYLADLIVPQVQELSMGARLNLDSTVTPPLLGLDGTPDSLQGQLDDVAIWNRALTADEISKVYAAGKAGNPVTSVVEAAPAGAPKLSVARSTTGLTLTFTGSLQSADKIAGPWTDVSGSSPMTVTATSAAKFFRAKQ